MSIIVLGQMRPKSRIWAQVTDSRGKLGQANISGASQDWANPDTETSIGVNKRNTGFQFWAEFWSRYRIQFPNSLNFGVGGDTAVNICVTNKAARLDVAIARAVAANAAGITFWMGTNDWSAGAVYADVIAAYEVAIAACHANGLLVMFVTDTPRGHSTFTGTRLSATALRRMLRARQWLLDQRNRTGVYVVDGWEDNADPASTVGDWASLQDTTDGLHLATRPASHIGQRIAKIAETLYPLINILPASNADLYDATDNPLGNLLANPMLDGTGGSVGGLGGTNAVAASWKAYFNNTTGLTGTTAIYSKVSLPDQETGASEVWQQLALAGTPSVANTYIGIQQDALSMVTIPVGSRVQAVCEVEWDAGMAGVEAVRMGIEGNRVSGPSGVAFWLDYAGIAGASGKEIDASKAYRGVMATEPYTLANDITSINMRMTCHFIQNAVLANANFRFGRPALRFVA